MSPGPGPPHDSRTAPKRKTAPGDSPGPLVSQGRSLSHAESQHHSPKRNKSLPAANTMSRAQGKRPGPPGIDMTSPQPRSAFQPPKGPKKLVIKNLRTTSRSADLERYYQSAFSDLHDALASIFARRQPKQPLERLYRAVEDICRHGQGSDLFNDLRDRSKDFLARSLLRSITSDAASSNTVDILRSVHKQYVIWMEQTTKIRSVFSYLDRSFLLNSKDLPSLNDLAISQFRSIVFPSAQQSQHSVGNNALDGMCELVYYDRKGDVRFDAALLRDSINMLRVLNRYGKSFEPRFLEKSSAYFGDFADEHSTDTLGAYVVACESLLGREDYRCNAYNFDSTTKRQIMSDARDCLVVKHQRKLLDRESVAKLIDDQAFGHMGTLYDLLQGSNLQRELTHPWEEYIRKTGGAMVGDTDRGDDMVVRLLMFRRSLDVMVRDAFKRDSDFTKGLRDGFSSFMNDKATLSNWDTGTSKVGEMVAKYMDMLLRGGIKAIPKDILSDLQDRIDAEQSGQASTADEDAELDRQLDQALELFRFIAGKDVFEAFYKQDLARRLLMGRSASADAERSMLSKLRNECGAQFTQNLEQMFKDQTLSREDMDAYKQWRDGHGHSRDGVDLNVNVLSAAAWPTYPDTQLVVPPEVASNIAQFERLYVNKHTGRKLTWKHSLAHCVVKARFNKGSKELLVSAFQAVVLAMFNQIEDKPDGYLTYDQISKQTGLSGGDLDRTLQSLACAKTRVLTKHPKGKDVNPTDTFTVNKTFTDPKYRVKINQIQLKETKQENKATHQRVAQDRQFETQAAIVRIMKSRKKMTHAELVAETINQTKSRGAVDPAEIKKNIEKLIEKEYLERDGTSYEYLA